MKYIIHVYEGEINGHGEKDGLPSEYQYELNKRCWSTFMISRTRSERTDGFKEIPQRFPKPRFWGVKNPMVNLGSSLSNEVMSSMFPPTRHSF